MAAAAALIGGAIANAVGFTGGQAIYRAVEGGPNPENERVRHDKALEALNKASVGWNEKRLKTLDFANRRLRREGQTESDFEDVDYALALYNRVHRSHVVLDHKPTLAEFYQPSETQKNYEYVFIAGAVATTGLLAYKFL